MASRKGLRKKSNEEFAELLANDPSRGISVLYDRFSPALFGVAFRILGSETLAEDALQDTFIKIWQSRHQYDPKKGTVFTWALNITRRTAIDRTRTSSFKYEKKSDYIENWEANGIPNYEYTLPTDTIGLRGVVDSLEKKQKEIIDLVYFQGFTHQEVQQELDIPLGTVKSRIRLAMQKMRALFEDHNIHLLWIVVMTIIAG